MKSASTGILSVVDDVTESASTPLSSSEPRHAWNPMTSRCKKRLIPNQQKLLTFGSPTMKAWRLKATWTNLYEEQFWLPHQTPTTVSFNVFDQGVDVYHPVSAVDNPLVSMAEHHTHKRGVLTVVLLCHCTHSSLYRLSFRAKLFTSCHFSCLSVNHPCLYYIINK